jgi:hypothetical protein
LFKVLLDAFEDEKREWEKRAEGGTQVIIVDSAQLTRPIDKERPERLQEWIALGHRDLSGWKFPALRFVDIAVASEARVRDETRPPRKEYGETRRTLNEYGYRYPYDYSKAAGEKRAREWDESEDEESSGESATRNPFVNRKRRLA